MEQVIGKPWVALAYLLAGVCFVTALRRLSSQRGSRFGIAGMTIAVVTALVAHMPGTLFDPVKAQICNEIHTAMGSGEPACRAITYVSSFAPDWVAISLIFVAIALGGAIGILTVRRIQITAMPRLVAAFHSLVGLAGVLVAAAAFLDPAAFGIADIVHPMIGLPFATIHPVSRIEMALGAALGAITFSGSVIAFLSLNGGMGDTPILPPMRHLINLGVLCAIVLLIAGFFAGGAAWMFWAIVGLSLAIGVLLIVPIDRADMPVMVSLLNSCSGWAAAAMGFMLHDLAMIIAGALVGSSGAVLGYMMCRAMNRGLLSVIAGGPDRRG